MKIANMRHRIEIFKPVYSADGEYGQDVKYSADGKAWAEILKPGFASAVLHGDGDAVRVTQGIRIRSRTIDAEWKVRWRGKVYTVVHVENRIPGEMILTTEEDAHGDLDII